MTVSTSHNARALQRGFYTAAEALEDLAAVNDEAGRLVLAASRPPRRTGELAAKLTARATGRDVVMASTARHFTFVHWGAPRVHVKAQPFVLAALRASRSEVADLYLSHATKALGRID